jgi:hypothetical protein
MKQRAAATLSSQGKTGVKGIRGSRTLVLALVNVFGQQKMVIALDSTTAIATAALVA